MAEAALEFLLNNLRDLLLYHPHLIIDAKSQIESLETDMRLLYAFLKDSHLKRRNDERTKELVRNIKDVVYEVEDVIDSFVTQSLERRATSSFFRVWKSSVSLHDIGVEVEKVKEKVERARVEFPILSAHDEDNPEKPEPRPPRPTNVVGYEDVMEELIHRLTCETDYFDVVCLTGMFGLGKSTVAWKIFNNPEIQYYFPVRIWLPISQEFTEKDIFLAILKEFLTVTEDVYQKKDKEIARMVTDFLERGSFLIVMDDVWTPRDWDRLRYALPDHNNKGKILITSRIEEVGWYACHPRVPRSLRFFTQDESWELLRLEALHTLDCPPELTIVGQHISSACRGLPLAIVIIGGILATKYSDSDLSATRKEWEEVSEHIILYISADSADRMKKFISLSYNRLPYHLRACFLYLGMFPEDYEISTSKLVRMWIGEGFIQQSTDSSLEETGEKYLEDLINRNLVRIEKTKHDGKVKTCRIHSTFRDFCRIEAQDDNFFHEIKSNNGVFSPPLSDLHKYRRLSLHSNCLRFISSKPFSHRVRSFVCYPKDKFILPLENVRDIPKAFKLLRVLDVKPFRFPKISSDLFQLVHVRYMALSLNLSILPSRFSQFWNLQTLIIDTPSRTLVVRADIWNLIQLRHFETNAIATLPKPSKDSKHGTKLQTLGTISMDSCTTKLCEQACNLKKLGIRGPLAMLLEGMIGSFESLGRMKHLENLKLINDVHPHPPLEGKLHSLPQPYQFPFRLKSLTLRGTFLDWSNMSTLAMLVILEVLKLKDHAFMGKCWEVANGGFLCLQFLHIEETDLEVWTASSHHYPRLRELLLRNCPELVAVPNELANIESFQELQLYECKSAVASARGIQEAKRKADAAFKLSVFPPTD